MSKDKISDYSATANSNTDIGGINIDEGCAPSGINDAIRTLMKQLKDFQQGTQSDVFKGPLQVGAASSIEVTDNSNAALRITQLGTGNALLVEDSSNPDSSPFVVNASGNVGIGTSSPDSLLEVSGVDESQIKVTGASGVEAVMRASASTVTFGSNTSHNLYLRTGNTARVTVDTSGNVGIGTTSPATILEAKTATGGVLTLSTSDTIVSSGDVLGGINFQAPNEASGTQAILVGASISAVASVANFSTTANNTDIVFSTNATAASPTEAVRIKDGGGLQISRTAVTAPATGDGNVFSGTYTPTYTAGTNNTSATVSACQYLRVGNTVTVSGSISVTCTTAAATYSVFEITLPIASNFSANRQCTGTATYVSSTSARNTYAVINCNTTTDRAEFIFACNYAGANVFYFNFTYQVI